MMAEKFRYSGRTVYLKMMFKAFWCDFHMNVFDSLVYKKC